MELSNGERIFTWPISRPHIITAGWTYTDGSAHRAIDFRANIGTPVYASEAGKVVALKYGWKTGNSKIGVGSYGNYVKLLHNSKYKGRTVHTLYAHLDRVTVRNGDYVNEGDIIGYTGNTGNSTGPHLHYEVLYNNNRVNPLNWLDADFSSANQYIRKHLGTYKSVAVPNLFNFQAGPMSKGDLETFISIATKLAIPYERRDSK